VDSTLSEPQPVLIADIGGTNIRLALAEAVEKLGSGTDFDVRYW
jgi:glucokinase